MFSETLASISFNMCAILFNIEQKIQNIRRQKMAIKRLYCRISRTVPNVNLHLLWTIVVNIIHNLLLLWVPSKWKYSPSWSWSPKCRFLGLETQSYITVVHIYMELWWKRKDNPRLDLEAGLLSRKCIFLRDFHCAQCLKITPNVAFEFWHFPSIFDLLKLTCLVTLFYLKLLMNFCPLKM